MKSIAFVLTLTVSYSSAGFFDRIKENRQERQCEIRLNTCERQTSGFDFSAYDYIVPGMDASDFSGRIAAAREYMKATVENEDFTTDLMDKVTTADPVDVAIVKAESASLPAEMASIRKTFGLFKREDSGLILEAVRSIYSRRTQSLAAILGDVVPLQEDQGLIATVVEIAALSVGVLAVAVGFVAVYFEGILEDRPNAILAKLFATVFSRLFIIVANIYDILNNLYETLVPPGNSTAIAEDNIPEVSYCYASLLQCQYKALAMTAMPALADGLETVMAMEN